MGISAGHIIIVLVVLLLIFGAGKIPQMMADLAKGIKAFKKGMNEEEETKPAPKLKLVKSEPAPKKAPAKKKPAAKKKPTKPKAKK